MEVAAIVLAISVVLAFVTRGEWGRRQKYRIASAALETESYRLTLKLQSLTEEHDKLQQKIAVLQSRMRAIPDAGSVVSAGGASRERFEQYLLREGIVTPQQFERAMAYRKASESALPIEHLLVLFDYISSAALAAAHAAFLKQRS